MHSNRIINKIRIYALFSFLIPLITINLCLLSYKLLGNIEIYKNYNWDQKFEIFYRTQFYLFFLIEG